MMLNIVADGGMSKQPSKMKDDEHANVYLKKTTIHNNSSGKMKNGNVVIENLT